jgi:hypothetical protein
LQLFALAYNLGNFLRRLALPKPVRHWSMTTLREKLIKIGAKVTRHAKYVTVQLAEVAVTRNLEKNSLRARRGGAARCYNRGQTESGSVPSSTQMGNVG